MQHNFKAGTYYIGDPCYAFQGNNWDKILDETGFFELDKITNGMWAGSTAFGDGTYTDQFSNEYPVDAGLIGIMPIEICDFGDIRWENGDWIDKRGITMSNGEKFEFKPGNVATFERDFTVNYENGKFEFGHIVIDTNGGDDDFDAEEAYL